MNTVAAAVPPRRTARRAGAARFEVFKPRIALEIMLAGVAGVAITGGPGLAGGARSCSRRRSSLRPARPARSTTCRARPRRAHVAHPLAALRHRRAGAAGRAGTWSSPRCWSLAVGRGRAGHELAGRRIRVPRRLHLRRRLHDVAEAPHLAQHRHRRPRRQLCGAGRRGGRRSRRRARPHGRSPWCCSCGRRRTSGAWRRTTGRTTPTPACRCCPWCTATGSRRGPSLAHTVPLVLLSLLPVVLGRRAGSTAPARRRVARYFIWRACLLCAQPDAEPTPSAASSPRCCNSGCCCWGPSSKAPSGAAWSTSEACVGVIRAGHRVARLPGAASCSVAWPRNGPAQAARIDRRRGVAHQPGRHRPHRRGRPAHRPRTARAHVEELRGRPVVLSLIYTSCYHVCPGLTLRLRETVKVARQALGADSFTVVTVGFDTRMTRRSACGPTHANAAREQPGWYFASARRRGTAHASRGTVGLHLRSPSPKGFDHITQTTIIDARGRVVLQVYGEDFAPPLVVEPLKKLVWGQNLDRSTLEGLVNTVKLLCTIYDPTSGRYRFDYSLIRQHRRGQPGARHRAGGHPRRPAEREMKRARCGAPWSRPAALKQDCAVWCGSRRARRVRATAQPARRSSARSAGSCSGSSPPAASTSTFSSTRA